MSQQILYSLAIQIEFAIFTALSIPTTNTSFSMIFSQIWWDLLIHIVKSCLSLGICFFNYVFDCCILRPSFFFRSDFHFQSFTFVIFSLFYYFPQHSVRHVSVLSFTSMVHFLTVLILLFTPSYHILIVPLYLISLLFHISFISLSISVAVFTF